LVHKVHYESILRDKQNVVKGIYDFIGDRRFGGVKRQSSVMIMNTTEDLIQGANKGREALKAQTLSFQFKNLVRTESFAKNQHAKWRHPENGLNEEELQLLESVAHRTMQRLDYGPHIVGVSALPTEFTDEDLKDFGRLNKAAINKMNQDLKEENPGDFERRMHQAEALSFLPTLEKEWDESEGTDGDDAAQAFLTEEQLATRLEVSAEKAASLPNGRRFRFSTASQRGYYPHEHGKPNQDASRSDVATNGGFHWFSVLDGHGPAGHECSGFSAQRIPQLFRASVAEGMSVKQAMEKSHEATHKQLTGNPDIESELSGTTATTLLLEGNKFIVANVGDSTCILGSKDSEGLSAKLLCSEHTPLRKDERARILKAGGVVMTADQRDRTASRHDNWDSSDAPPRIWSRDGTFPGCAFSRSIGDSIAHSLGVSARPEVFIYNIKKENHVVIVASDGITECKFLEMRTDVVVISICKTLFSRSTFLFCSLEYSHGPANLCGNRLPSQQPRRSCSCIGARV
jgi:serine/threonine protein phosphatase PrpC